MNPDDIKLTAKWSEFFKLRGYQPIPSRTDEKRPMVRFGQWWEEKAPDDLFAKHPTTNVQVMTGRAWGLLVIDLDGPEAQEHWKTLGTCPPTWVVHSGGKGQHWWFSISRTGPEIRKAILWKGEGEHSAIERLCDKSLVMAPPSIHPKTGNRYRFLGHHQSPARLPMPAPCPAWVFGLAPLVMPRLVCHAPAEARSLPTARDPRPPSGRRYDKADVLAAIPSKLALVREWGLRLDERGRPSPNGWYPCHAVGRDDNRPSAAINVQTGFYSDLGSGTRASLFDLAMLLGVYPSFREAISDLGDRFHAPYRTA